MKIFHIIRNTVSLSLFKEIIQECIHSGLGDTVYISSGFFQEPTRGNFSASKERDSKGRSFDNNTNHLTLHLRGVYNAAWKGSFQSFVNVLQGTGCYQIWVNKMRYNPGMSIPTVNKNHAKVFIYEKKGEPLLEILGSSNLTSHAYGTNFPYNTEADLVICNNKKLENAIIKMFQNSEIQHGVMILNYDNINNSPLDKEMKWIRDNLF